MMEFLSFHFIGEEITVEFKKPLLFEKQPRCPDALVWRGERYRIVELLAEWQDLRRRGRMERNMRPTHADCARRTGSWGVGRTYFRVRTENGKVFDLYYDRAPQNADQRKGVWILKGECKPV